MTKPSRVMKAVAGAPGRTGSDEDAAGGKSSSHRKSGGNNGDWFRGVSVLDS